MNSIVYVALVVFYVMVMLAVGYWCMKRTRDVGDFFLGGRTLGPWMSAFAYGTTYFSAVLFIGYAGKLGWGFGIHTMWIVLGNTFVGTFLAWLVLAGRTREMTTRLNAITMPEFLSARYNHKPLQVVAALVVFVFLVPYSASVLMGLSYLFEMTLHISYESALYFPHRADGSVPGHGRLLRRRRQRFHPGHCGICGSAADGLSARASAGDRRFYPCHSTTGFGSFHVRRV